MTELVDETTADIRRSARRAVRKRSAFEVWAWSPVIVLRVALVITYLMYVDFAVVSFIAGVPLFKLIAPDGYTHTWAILLATSAVIAAVGAIDDRWVRWERWASLSVSGLMFAYVGGLNLVGFVTGDATRQAVGAATAIALVLPVCRFVYLAAQTGKKKAEKL